MDISYNWLRQYVDYDGAPEDLAETLTMGGLEVEGIDHIGQALDGVVVGEVKAVRNHPNADRIVLCDVDCGDGEPVQIACGAPNVAEGQKVPIATPGTTLHLPSRDNPEVREPLTIEARKLRGEMSNGMICAEDELGLSDDHSGIMVLDTDADIGQPFPDYLDARGVNVTDAIFDIGLTPNRPDAASHYGVARDVAALTDSALSRPEVSLPENGGPAADQVTVDMQAPEACPRYVALLVKGVTVQESPLWLKRRLMSIGLRPRNNIVDITNFVLHECGQPLHAFDFHTLAESKIRVRSTDTPGQTFTTLDGEERELPEGALLSHDHFEGAFARCGLASDVELFDDFPTHYEQNARRLHRWARGDWQLLPWILGHPPEVEGRDVPAMPPFLSWWKMVDNLRRTLSAPSALLLLVAGPGLAAAGVAREFGRLRSRQ